MKSVAIFGQMFSGKSTVADALADAGYQRMSFAGPLKNVAALSYGPISKSKMYKVVRYHPDVSQDGAPVATREEVSGREILQGIGQTVKQVDRDFWLNAFILDSKHYLDTPLVVDDGRFIFEFEALRDHGLGHSRS